MSLPYLILRHGLSYTNFELSDLKISEPSSHDTAFKVEVTVSVKNTGAMAGSEVVQLYIAYPDVGVTIPKLQLRGFAKAHDLAPGESKTVIIHLDRYAISFWDTQKGQWMAKEGAYGILVGHSSLNLPLQGEVELKTSFWWKGI